MYNTISIACVRPVERFYISGLSNSQWMVYPHVCGEHSPFKSLNENPSGTSPRLWGDYSGTPPHVRVLRYIPTPVGRLSPFFFLLAAPTVHPHACGEIIANFYKTNRVNGTSPRLWGDYCQFLQDEPRKRYIPTPVGRFIRTSDIVIFPPVNPHACGEIGVISRERASECGTSPRLWGDWAFKIQRDARARYIPTPVGRLYLLWMMTVLNTVHPHACGEIPACQSLALVGRGTSPRLWGDWLPVLFGSWGRRYIPTPVGRFLGPCQSGFRRSVHPHACGEILWLSYCCCWWCGTSPRLWGDFSTDVVQI